MTPGIINTFLLDTGLIQEPIPLIRTTLGVLLGMSQILLPFMVLPIYAVMRRIDPEFTRAAANLGAPPFAAFRRVFLPLSPARRRRRCRSSSSSSPSASTSRRPSSAQPKDTMISQFIASAVQQRLDWGIGATMAVILMGVTLVVLLVASRFIRLRDVFGSLEES